MKIFKTIKDEDVSSTALAPEKFIERKAARGIVFDNERKIALFHSTQKNYHKLPGGGVEGDENLEIALRRELLEEIGYNVENIKELGIIEEFRNEVKLHQLSYCYIADVMGEKREPQLTEGEMEEGFKAEWLDLDSAIKILEDESSVENYEGKFMQMRDLIFLKEAKKVLA